MSPLMAINIYLYKWYFHGFSCRSAAFEHRKLWGLQRLCWLPSERSLPIVLYLLVDPHTSITENPVYNTPLFIKIQTTPLIHPYLALMLCVRVMQFKGPTFGFCVLWLYIESLVCEIAHHSPQLLLMTLININSAYQWGILSLVITFANSLDQIWPGRCWS